MEYDTSIKSAFIPANQIMLEMNNDQVHGIYSILVLRLKFLSVGCVALNNMCRYIRKRHCY